MDFIRQRAADVYAKRPVEAELFVLDGGPGVGKSTTSKLLAHELRKDEYDPLLCGTTGRAACNLSKFAATAHSASPSRSAACTSATRYSSWDNSVGASKQHPALLLAQRAVQSPSVAQATLEQPKDVC